MTPSKLKPPRQGTVQPRWGHFCQRAMRPVSPASPKPAWVPSPARRWASQNLPTTWRSGGVAGGGHEFGGDGDLGAEALHAAGPEEGEEGGEGAGESEAHDAPEGGAEELATAEFHASGAASLGAGDDSALGRRASSVMAGRASVSRCGARARAARRRRGASGLGTSCWGPPSPVPPGAPVEAEGLTSLGSGVRCRRSGACCRSSLFHHHDIPGRAKFLTLPTEGGPDNGRDDIDGDEAAKEEQDDVASVVGSSRASW